MSLPIKRKAANPFTNKKRSCKIAFPIKREAGVTGYCSLLLSTLCLRDSPVSFCSLCFDTYFAAILIIAISKLNAFSYRCVFRLSYSLIFVICCQNFAAKTLLPCYLPRWTRTTDIQLRRLTLYPTELWVGMGEVRLSKALRRHPLKYVHLSPSEWRSHPPLTNQQREGNVPRAKHSVKCAASSRWYSKAQRSMLPRLRCRPCYLLGVIAAKKRKRPCHPIKREDGSQYDRYDNKTTTISPIKREN